MALAFTILALGRVSNILIVERLKTGLPVSSWLEKRQGSTRCSVSLHTAIKFCCLLGDYGSGTSIGLLASTSYM